ncbi:hypothetical protein I6B53_03370 [Schaalia sp. 19OD2882]|uniref:hypothetical protein n=1 Tax=Schaalia sp. 19OD2882 TaxID=2794089 RepID=UPI001C1EFE23|nr:hypothetical protein [Schaalia sp. 19OD2882]QWW20151.1 hypothetical protein I6B53_03370 [Schaalia sp. 19OD2882]
MTRAEIACATGMSVKAVSNYFYRSNKVAASTARRIMSISVEDVKARRGEVLVPAWGATRRLRALAVLGWDANALAQRIGVSAARVEGITADDEVVELPAAEASRIATAYDVLCLRRPASWESPDSASREAVARSLGWAEPAQWAGRDLEAKGARPLQHGRFDAVPLLEVSALSATRVQGALVVRCAVRLVAGDADVRRMRRVLAEATKSALSAHGLVASTRPRVRRHPETREMAMTVRVKQA